MRTERLNELVEHPGERALTKLFLASKTLLAEPKRGGQRGPAHGYAAHGEHTRAPKLSQPHHIRLPKAARKADGGLLSKAAALLCSRGLADPSAELLGKVKQLFPEGRPPRCLHSPVVAVQGLGYQELDPDRSSTPGTGAIWLTI